MGYVLFTARKLMLTSRLNNLNLQEMLLSQQQMDLANQQLAIQLGGGGGDTSKLEQISTQENIIDMKMKALETQIKAIQAELESVEKAEDKGIKDAAPKYGQG